MKKEITYYIPAVLQLTAGQMAKLEKSHREHWGDPNYQLTDFDFVETAMRTGLIAEEEGFGVLNEQGGVSF